MEYDMVNNMKVFNYNKNTYPWECAKQCEQSDDVNNMITQKQYMPIQSMSSKIYTYIYQIVVVNKEKHMPGGSMPKAICKDEFNSIVNDCMCELTKDEKKYKEMIKSRCTREEESRAFCENCNGLLKSVIEVALITSLLNGGCAFCY